MTASYPPSRLACRIIIIVGLILSSGSISSAAVQCRELFEFSLKTGVESTSENARLFYHRDVADAVSGNFERFAGDRYGFGGVRALSALESLGPQFRELIADPGIALRAENFKQFVIGSGLERAEPWAARELFSQYLGTRTVYRALNLTAADHANIMRNGMDSALLRSSDDVVVQLKVLMNESLSSHVSRRVRPQTSNSRDPLMSVSGDPTIAAAASSQARVNEVFTPLQSGNIFGFFAGSMMQPLKSTYLYTIKIPEIDLIYSGLNKNILPVRYDSRKLKMSVGSLTSLPKTFDFSNPIVESFILIRVEPHEIQSGRALSPLELSPVPFFGQTQ